MASWLLLSLCLACTSVTPEADDREVQSLRETKEQRELMGQCATSLTDLPPLTEALSANSQVKDPTTSQTLTQVECQPLGTLGTEP